MKLPIDQIICDSALTVLADFPADSVDCIVTSPPYWGLRDYGEDTATVWGGDPDCEHEWGEQLAAAGSRSADAPERIGNKGTEARDKMMTSAFCHKCGAWYGQLGLEPHPGDYEIEIVLMELRTDLTEEQRGEIATYFDGDI